MLSGYPKKIKKNSSEIFRLTNVDTYLLVQVLGGEVIRPECMTEMLDTSKVLLS